MTDFLQRLNEANAERAKAFPDYNRFLNKEKLYYAVALAGEVGEMLNVIKKLERGDAFDRDGKTPIVTALENEIADVLIQLDLLCQVCNIELTLATKNKFNNKSLDIMSKIFL